jgi:dolichyl-phosphate-mannose--protein O-mannosyl transferase
MSELDWSGDPLPVPSAIVPNRSIVQSFIRSLLNLFSEVPSKSLVLDATDAVAILFLTALGMITRVFRIQFPPYVVFDETYFGTFTNWYLSGTYFTDIHPPLAKLIMAGVANYAGYKGDYDFYGLGDSKKYPTMMYVTLRLTPAFFGALCIPLIYFAMRAMLCSHFAAFTASILLTADIMLIVEARHILSDPILHFFTCLSIFSIFLYERSGHLLSFIFEGICLGCVAACKYTAGGVVLLALIRQFPLSHFPRKSFWPKIPSAIIRCGLLCLIVVAIHFICFSIHLTILPYFPEDKSGVPSAVRAGLVDRLNPDWESRSKAPSMLLRVLQLVTYMHEGNMRIEGGHPYASKWYTWPLFTGKWVGYWVKEEKHILCMGNVLVWWPVFAGVLISVVKSVLERDVASEGAAMLSGWAFSFLPFALIPREMFLYHYAIPLIFGCCGLVVLVERAAPPLLRGFLYAMLMVLAVIGFLVWCPWAYGLTTPDFYWLVWNRNWR